MKKVLLDLSLCLCPNGPKVILPLQRTATPATSRATHRWATRANGHRRSTRRSWLACRGSWTRRSRSRKASAYSGCLLTQTDLLGLALLVFGQTCRSKTLLCCRSGALPEPTPEQCCSIGEGAQFAVGLQGQD